MDFLVSVIIPVYNRAESLIRAVNSVLNQSYGNIEVIVVDDGSSCDIAGIVSGFNSDKVRFIRNDVNRGVSYARNCGIRASRGEYIALLDSDDEWFSDKLERQLVCFRDCDVRLVHGEEVWMRNGVRVNQGHRHRKEGGDIFVRSLDLCLISPSAVIVHKSIFERYGLFREDFPVCEDYDMWLRITLFEKVAFVKEPVIYKYGGHDDQLSRRYHSMDRYRVYAMSDLLSNNCIEDSEKKDAVVSKIIEKCNILIKGACKREKYDEVREYEDIIKRVSCLDSRNVF